MARSGSVPGSGWKLEGGSSFEASSRCDCPGAMPLAATSARPSSAALWKRLAASFSSAVSRTRPSARGTSGRRARTSGGEGELETCTSTSG